MAEQSQDYISLDEFRRQAEAIEPAYEANKELLKAYQRQVNAIKRGGVQPRENEAYAAALSTLQKTQEQELAINRQYEELFEKLSPEDQKLLEDAQADALKALDGMFGGAFTGTLEGAKGTIDRFKGKVNDTINRVGNQIENAAKSRKFDTLGVKNGYGEIRLDDKFNCVVINEGGHETTYDLNNAKASTVNGLINDAGSNSLDLIAFGSWNEWFQNKYALYEGQISQAEYSARMQAAGEKAEQKKIDPKLLPGDDVLRQLEGTPLGDEVIKRIEALKAGEAPIEPEPKAPMAILPATEGSVCFKR